MLFELFEQPTIANAGVLTPMESYNRLYAISRPMIGAFYLSPTVSSDGALLKGFQFSATGNPNQAGDMPEGITTHTIVLLPSTEYLVRMTAEGGSNTLNISLDIVEVPLYEF